MVTPERTYNGGVGAEPPVVSGAVPLVRGVRGTKPPEAESFLRIGHPKEGANWWSDCHECHLLFRTPQKTAS